MPVGRRTRAADTMRRWYAHWTMDRLPGVELPGAHFTIQHGLSLCATISTAALYTWLLCDQCLRQVINTLLALLRAVFHQPAVSGLMGFLLGRGVSTLLHVRIWHGKFRLVVFKPHYCHFALRQFQHAPSVCVARSAAVAQDST